MHNCPVVGIRLTGNRRGNPTDIKPKPGQEKRGAPVCSPSLECPSHLIQQLLAHRSSPIRIPLHRNLSPRRHAGR